MVTYNMRCDQYNTKAIVRRPPRCLLKGGRKPVLRDRHAHLLRFCGTALLCFFLFVFSAACCGLMENHKAPFLDLGRKCRKFLPMALAFQKTLINFLTNLATLLIPTTFQTSLLELPSFFSLELQEEARRQAREPDGNRYANGSRSRHEPLLVVADDADCLTSWD